MYKTRIPAIIAVATALFAASAPAQAAPAKSGYTGTVIRVVDSNGVPQPGAIVAKSWNSEGKITGSYTKVNAAGESIPVNMVSGERFLIRRYMDRPWSEDACQSPEASAPEGKGVIYQVPDNPSGQITVVVPALSHRDYVSSTPGNTTAERGLVGLINKAREARGLSPLEIETRLSDMSDRYANYMNLHGLSLPCHCGFYDSRTRVSAAGFWGPTAEVTSVGKQADSPLRDARAAFESWKRSSVHWSVLMENDYTASVIGIGSATVNGVTSFIGQVGRCSGAESCDLTGDIGDASLLDGADNPVGRPELPAALKMRVVRSVHHGRHVRIIVRSNQNVKLASKAKVRGRGRGQVQARAHGKRIVFSANLERGKWTVRARVKTASGQAKRLKIKVRLVSERGSGKVAARLR